MSGEILTPEDAWGRIATPEKATVIRGVVRLAIDLTTFIGNLSLKDVGSLFETLDKPTADLVAYGLSGVADGELVHQVGRKLRED